MRRHGNNPSPFKVVRMDPTERIVSMRFPQALAEGVKIAREMFQQVKGSVQGVQVSAPFGRVEVALEVFG